MTHLQISPTQAGLNAQHAVGEQYAFAKASKRAVVDHNLGSDSIAAALRQMHDAVASETMPDDFLKMLDDIDRKIADTARISSGPR